MIPSAVFFDMDGTLIDSEPIWFATEKELMAQFDYEWTLKDQGETVGGPLARVGRIMADKARSTNGPEFFSESLISMVSQNFARDLKFMPGALELLQAINSEGIPTALVTASPFQLAQVAVEALPSKLFDLVISSDDVENTKPHPECYLKAAKSLGVDISNCLVLEDTNTGVSAAEASGAFVVAIPHIATINPRDRVRVIKTLENLSVQELFSLH